MAEQLASTLVCHTCWFRIMAFPYANGKNKRNYHLKEWANDCRGVFHGSFAFSLAPACARFDTILVQRDRDPTRKGSCFECEGDCRPYSIECGWSTMQADCCYVSWSKRIERGSMMRGLVALAWLTMDRMNHKVDRAESHAFDPIEPIWTRKGIWTHLSRILLCWRLPGVQCTVLLMLHKPWCFHISNL